MRLIQSIQDAKIGGLKVPAVNTATLAAQYGHLPPMHWSHLPQGGLV